MDTLFVVFDKTNGTVTTTGFVTKSSSHLHLKCSAASIHGSI